MRYQRQKLPFTFYQRRGLSLFGSHRKMTIARVSHCDARVPVEINNFHRKNLDFRSVLRQAIVGHGTPGAGHSVLGQNVSGAGRHWGNISGAERRGAAGQWGRTSWGRTSWGRSSLGQYSWGRTSWGRRSVGQEVGNPQYVLFRQNH